MHSELYWEGQDKYLPRREHHYDVAYDIKAKEEIIINPGEFKKIGTGFKMDTPCKVATLVLARSSIFAKGIMIQGLIDPDFQDEIFVQMFNIGKEQVVIKKDEFYAQFLFLLTPNTKLIQVDKLPWRKCRRYSNKTRKMKSFNKNLSIFTNTAYKGFEEQLEGENNTYFKTSSGIHIVDGNGNTSKLLDIEDLDERVKKIQILTEEEDRSDDSDAINSMDEV